MNPTLIVIAYNRVRALQRLLQSLRAASYPPNVRLIISIDAGGEQQRQVYEVAQRFGWPHGEKEVRPQERPLGLIDHVFACGDLSQQVGPIVLLEDDLFVSPVFYHFATQALDCYADDARIAGISLNALWFNGYTHQPFEPYLDDADVFFMQVPWYQGQAYTATQWARFMAWREKASWPVTAADGLHPMFTRFPETDWFPIKMKYLAQSQRYYVFPRHALTTNFGEVGTHFQQETDFFQVPLQTRRRQYRLHGLDRSLAVYDTFQEMTPTCLNRLTDRFAAYDYTVDLNGTHTPATIGTEYVLTTQPMRQPLASFGLHMRPRVANVVHGVPGHAISFGKTAALQTGRRARWMTRWRNVNYATRGKRPSRRQRLQQWLGRRLSRA